MIHTYLESLGFKLQQKYDFSNIYTIDTDTHVIELELENKSGKIIIELYRKDEDNKDVIHFMRFKSFKSSSLHNIPKFIESVLN